MASNSTSDIPSWDDAPEWANFLAMDSNGAWYWYSTRPKSNDEEWMPDYSCMTAVARNSYPYDWFKSLQERPNGKI